MVKHTRKGWQAHARRLVVEPHGDRATADAGPAATATIQHHVGMAGDSAASSAAWCGIR